MDRPSISVLIANDEESVLSELVTAFKTLKPWGNMTPAVDGEDAVAKTRTNLFDIAVLDVLMRKSDDQSIEKNGPQALAKIQSLCPGVKHLLVTGTMHDLHEVARQAQAAGAQPIPDLPGGPGYLVAQVMVDFTDFESLVKLINAILDGEYHDLPKGIIQRP